MIRYLWQQKLHCLPLSLPFLGPPRMQVLRLQVCARTRIQTHTTVNLSMTTFTTGFHPPKLVSGAVQGSRGAVVALVKCNIDAHLKPFNSTW